MIESTAVAARKRSGETDTHGARPLVQVEVWLGHLHLIMAIAQGHMVTICPHQCGGMVCQDTIWAGAAWPTMV